VNRFIYIVSLLFLNVVSANTALQDSLAVSIDSSPVTEKSFSEELSKKYTGSDFDYESVEGEAQNFLGRAINWFFNKLGDLFGLTLSPEWHDIIEFLVYLLLTVIVGYFIIKLLVGNSAGSLFTRKITSVAAINSKEEHLHSIDLDELIKEALAVKDYRLAIRYMYLKSLKELSLYNFIEWHFDKTNNDYSAEIEDPLVKSNFKKISYVYDYVWYGEFTLDEHSFFNAKKDFDQLTQTFKNAG
jgi:hypothetical protein